MENKEPGGYYNLGVLYLKGIGLKRDLETACKLFLAAANTGQPKAVYQVARLFQTGIGLKKNLQIVLFLSCISSIFYLCITIFLILFSILLINYLNAIVRFLN